MKISTFKIVFTISLALFLMACSQQSNKTQFDVKNGVKFTTTTTPNQQLLIIEPENPDKKNFETTVVYLANSSGGTGDSKCYTCWRNYFDCIFRGGANCTDIGKSCDKICKDERGIVLAPTSFEAISAKLEGEQK